MEVAPLSHADVEAAADTITLAFSDDPVWTVALEGLRRTPGELRRYWRFYIDGARRYDTVFASAGAGTVSVWIPPGGTEMSEDQEAALRQLAAKALGPARSQDLFDLWALFDEHHPTSQPHAYLSLLATRPDLAGHGRGQAHLAADLERWDQAGVPTYLESSNPRNNHRYERQGYARIGEFMTVLDMAVVTTMWRPVGG